MPYLLGVSILKQKSSTNPSWRRLQKNFKTWSCIISKFAYCIVIPIGVTTFAISTKNHLSGWYRESPQDPRKYIIHMWYQKAVRRYLAVEHRWRYKKHTDTKPYQVQNKWTIWLHLTIIQQCLPQKEPIKRLPTNWKTTIYVYTLRLT